MNTKYVKVSTADRLPEKEGKYLIYHKGFKSIFHSSFKPQYQEMAKYFDKNIDYWLEEKPDYEEEMRGMLEECKNQLEHLNNPSRGTTNSVLSRLETLLDKINRS
ncbi:hypothetical protein BN1195_03631 [Chryseobacterium oranimense G311]|uniref:hypothetical protein n=1 Tax=Chryseobacterium oranimense TaxID=421058 RepID=UPI00053395F8|nr:hypothetical protein [Chryseobacterium oranimense]CEJ71286.1 hypothetical protein BN1195_03631 [Chryseobacterium oranimense G311]DAG72850.1 MAG TPA: hypothetical protein [Caudoviricetes sp.]